ncbi:FERM domain-containing protein 5 [Eufriesea mexicana]|uniref:FERM domain-containing protein 5 n=1 Tax=Eufriesea mexicana TaxID=516756 RepID=A0A310SJ80_9HYME|nr:FERM domain-containing protein 5 [Eufriesea mexicana]
MFIVHLTISEKKHTVGFKCPTGSNCRHVWRCAIEQMLFFTLSRASDAPVVSGGSIFSWGTKFKYTGRTEKEVLEETGPLRKEEPPIQRCQTTCLRRKASSVPATPSTPSQDLVEIRYSSLPRSCLSAGLDGAGMSEGSTGVSFSSPYCPDNTLPLLEPVSEDQEIHGRRNNVRMKYPKSTLNRPQPLYSQKIVIGSEELVGRDIDNVVRQRINALEKSPKVVRSTALIIKSSKVPAESNEQVSMLARQENEVTCRGIGTTTKTANGYITSATTDVADVRNGVEATKRRERTVGQHECVINDYYFRDSFDHSSSDSQLLDASGKPHSPSMTPTDTTLFNNLRKTPEMVALQNQYYVPIKEFLRTKLGLF